VWLEDSFDFFAMIHDGKSRIVQDCHLLVVEDSRLADGNGHRYCTTRCIVLEDDADVRLVINALAIDDVVRVTRRVV
jgi:hypothetical protein